MGASVFITRPEHQAAGLTRAVAARGFTPVAAPCLKLVIERGPKLDLTGIGGIAVTSANGVLALAARTAERGLPLYAVGRATAETARELGFSQVETADGDGAALARLIGERAVPRPAAILHASGADSAFDLVAALAAYDIRADRAGLYDMPVVPNLPANALAILDAGQPSFVLLMSARTAQAFGKLVTESGRAAALGPVAALCLSPAIAEAAQRWPFGTIAAAGRPTQDALLDLLEAHSARL